MGLVEFLFTGLYRAKKGIEEKPGGYQPRTVTWDFWRFKGWYGCSRFYKCVYGISSPLKLIEAISRLYRLLGRS